MANTDSYIVMGDDAEIVVELKKDKALFNIPLTAIIKAALVTTDHKQILIPEVSVANNHPDGDWTISTIVVPFTEEQTSAIPYDGMALIEVQVNDSGKLTFFTDIQVLSGKVA